MKTIRFLFFLPLLALAACQPSVTEQAIRQQLRDFPETRAQDIYKSFYQDNLGPGHLIPDPESARSYLRKELQTCREERENQQYVAFGRPYEPVGDQGNYVRVDLSVVLDGLVGEEALLDAFVRSANAGRTVSKEAWVSRWRDVEALLRKKFSSIPDLEADLQRIDSLLGAGNLTLHHSRAFGEAYHP
ncbi:MAG: hypothetical protein IJ636_06520, partial [Bacteroidales bacterium]|nr:hypothetical protein [Bacteroidales bacterium]